MSQIEAKDVRKSFGDETVLDGIDLTVNTDEILVLMGPNGAGKTTFLSCLAGSENVTSGTVTAFGDSPSKADGKISFLLQETAAMERLTGRENIEFYSRTYSEFTSRWEEYVETLGIADDLDKRVANYSGGMKRKLELAIVLSAEAEVYFLDEPTAGVDLSAIGKIHKTILDLHERGKGILLASHRPLDFDIADRIAFMGSGTVEATGEPMSLIEGLPTTVRFPSVRSSEVATDHLQDVFYVGSEVRGFLTESSTRQDVVDVVADEIGTEQADRIVTVEPGFSDAFNFYAHVR